MVAFSEDLPLGPGGGGRVGHVQSIEELGGPLVVPDKLVVEGHRLIVWSLLLTEEALHYGPQIFGSTHEVHSIQILLSLSQLVIGDFHVNLLDQLLDVQVSRVIGLEVILLLSKNCCFSWEEWLDLRGCS